MPRRGQLSERHYADSGQTRFEDNQICLAEYLGRYLYRPPLVPQLRMLLPDLQANGDYQHRLEN